MKKLLSAAILCFLAAMPLRAQFFTHGADPGALRWYTIESPHYKMIYPDGADSLARSYARLLEQFRVPVGRSLNVVPGEGMWGKMPVVLHTHNVYSNGSVGWSPTRIDLFTVPEPYGSDPVSWELQLASHEPRHQAQMEKFEKRGFYRGLSYVIGQGATPIAWQIYLAFPRGEGDAVAVETGLLDGTRARTADFLGYMRVAFDQGDWRNFTRWSKGSYKYYTPDYYKPGYMLMAGTRYLYGAPAFAAEALEYSAIHPLWFAPFNFNRKIKQLSGKKADESWKDIQQAFQAVWEADAAARAPFLELNQLTPAESFPMDYATPQWVDGGLYVLRDGYLHSRELVRVEGEKITFVQHFASHTSSLFYEESRNRLYWSETRRDPRWELAGTSVIRYKDLGDGRTRSLTSGTRYYNPQPSEDGSFLAVVEYPVEGGSAAVIISTDDGRPARRIPAPEGVQLTESAWQGDDVFYAGVSAQGYGIYLCTPSGEWKTVLPPSHQKVVNLGSGDGFLEWVSDRSGVNELYRYSLAEGLLSQITNTRYGATDFCDDGNTLYCVSQTLDGMQLFTVPLSELRPRNVNFSDTHSYTIEDSLSRQEEALGPGPDFSMEVPLSTPKRYYKLPHFARLHTWLPLYVNVDNVSDLSFDEFYKSVSPGLTGFFQNTLGTFSGQLGYSVHPDPDNSSGPWRHGFHTSLIYSGLYPVLEARLDVGGSDAREYWKAEGEDGSLSNASQLRGAPLVEGRLKAYIPLSMSRGGRLYGVVPQLSYTYTNNVYHIGTTAIPETDAESGETVWTFKQDAGARDVRMHRMSASLRGYYMLPKADSQIYPRWGVGAEAGGLIRPGLTGSFRPLAYCYLYGYLPGITRSHGIRLTAIAQKQWGEAFFGDQGVNILPRGFDGGDGLTLASDYRDQWKLTADYGIPIFVGDLSVPLVGYIRNFVLTPHFDYAGLGRKDNLWSLGADFVADMGMIITFNVDASLGVSFNYLGGNVFDKAGMERKYAVSLIFDMDF